MGWGTHVNPWLIHVNVWQKPLQYCKVISLQLIKINEKNHRNYDTTQGTQAWDILNPEKRHEALKPPQTLLQSFLVATGRCVRLYSQGKGVSCCTSESQEVTAEDFSSPISSKVAFHSLIPKAIQTFTNFLNWHLTKVSPWGSMHMT